MNLCEIKGLASKLGYQVEEHKLNHQAGCIVVTCCCEHDSKSARFFYANSGLRPSRGAILEHLNHDLHSLLS